MWLGFSHLFSYKCMYAGGVNLTSLLFMNTYHIYIFIVWFVFTPLLMIDKKRERNSENVFEFICMFRHSEIDFEFLCMFIFTIDIEHICFCLCKKREVFFTYACLCWAFITYLYVYCYAWVKGELLWSLTLIHAYITPWVLSSSKRGRLLAQRPFTLVLMMINSCSYSLLIILWYLVSDIWSRY